MHTAFGPRGVEGNLLFNVDGAHFRGRGQRASFLGLGTSVTETTERRKYDGT